MKAKDAVIIAMVTLGIICGAVTGIVGGAFSFAAAGAGLHIAIDNAGKDNVNPY